MYGLNVVVYGRIVVDVTLFCGLNGLFLSIEGEDGIEGLNGRWLSDGKYIEGGTILWGGTVGRNWPPAGLTGARKKIHYLIKF